MYTKGCNEYFYVSFYFLSFLDTLFMYLRSCDHVVIANLVLVDIYIYIYIYIKVVIAVISLISTCVVSFLSLCTYFFFIVCNLLFLFHTKMP